MDNKPIKIFQINAARSKTVMAELRNVVDAERADIVCIQEPYSQYGKLASVPAKARTIITDRGMYVLSYITQKSNCCK